MASVKTDELKAIDKLGAVGIIREASKIFQTYFKVFLLIQVTLIADVIAASLVVEYFLFKSVPQPPPPPRSPGFFLGRSRLTHHFSAGFSDGRFFDSPIDLLVPFVVGAILGIIVAVLMSLSLSASTYCVRLYYAGKPVSFLDVIRAVVPRVWIRFAVTSTIGILLAELVGFAQTASSILLIPTHASPWLVVVVTLVILLVTLVLAFSVTIIFSVAQSLSVFEEDYGWAAAKKALKLLKGKLDIAISLRLLYMVANIITSIFVYGMFPYAEAPFDDGPWQFVLTVVYIIWVSFLSQFIALCSAVQYVSFKAHHDLESLINSISPEHTEQAGHGADEPLLSEQGAGGNV